MNLEEYNLCLSSSFDMLDVVATTQNNNNNNNNNNINHNNTHINIGVHTSHNPSAVCSVATSVGALSHNNFPCYETCDGQASYGYPFSSPSISPSMLHRPPQHQSSSLIVPPTIITTAPSSSLSARSSSSAITTTTTPTTSFASNRQSSASSNFTLATSSSIATTNIEQTEYYQAIKATFDELSRESVKIAFPKVEPDGSSPTHASPFLLGPSTSAGSSALSPSSQLAHTSVSPSPVTLNKVITSQSLGGTMSLDHFNNVDVEIVSERKTHERGFMILAPKLRYSRRSLNIELPLFVLRKGKDDECEWEDVTHYFKGKHISYLEDAKNTRRDQAHKEGKSERRGEFSIGMVHPLNVKLSHAGRWWLVIESLELAEMIDFEMKTLTEPRGSKKKGVVSPSTSTSSSSSASSSNNSPSVSSPSPSPLPIQTTSPTMAAPRITNNYQSIIQTTFNTVLPVSIYPGQKRMRGEEERLIRPEDLWNSYFEGADYQTSVERFIEFWETIDDSFQRNYKKIVEHHFSQPIARKHFLRFVACFGPIQGSAERLLDLYKCEVYWELGTTEACRKFMQSKPPYHFIVRRSYDNNQDHHFVLAVSQPSAEHAVAEYRITRVYIEGKSWLVIPKAVKEADSRFESFCAMVSHFAQRWKPIYNALLPGRIEETISNVLF